MLSKETKENAEEWLPNYIVVYIYIYIYIYIYNQYAWITGGDGIQTSSVNLFQINGD